jgi:integrase
MSSDKEPADIAMEFLAEDPASPWQEASPALPTAFKTAQDLLDWVKSDPDRDPYQRSNESSAIRALERIVNTPLAAIPVDEQYLLNVCYKAIRAEKSLKKRRRNEIITLLNRVLKRAGIIKVGSRRSGRTSVAWIKLLKSTSNRNDEYGLNTFAIFCSVRDIEPDQVTRKVWDEFVDETMHHSGTRKPRETVRRVVIANNRARTKVHNWPLPELPKLVNPRLVSIPKSDLAASFWADVDRYVQMSSTPSPDIFDRSWPKQLSPDTLARYREVVLRTASAQVHQGRPAGEIVSLTALLDYDWLYRAMSWFHARAGNKFLKDHLNIAATWLSLADNYVHSAAAVRKNMREVIFDMIAKQLGPPEFSRRNIERLEQFDDPTVVDEFLMMPYRIFDEVSRKKVLTVEDATLMMAAVGVELLLTTMVRRKNLANADLKMNFWPATPRPDGTWAFRVKAKEVKNHKDLDFKLGKETTRLIEFHLKKCRPLLVRHPTTALFLRTDGTPKGSMMMAHLIVNTVRKRLGLEVNLHLFRHIGAMLFLDQHPGSLEVVRVMLGHGSTKTTEKFYARLKATKAIDLFTTAVLGGRDAKIQQLKLGRKK